MKIGSISDVGIDLSRCRIWQYDNAPYLNEVMDLFDSFVKENGENFWKKWESNVFNLKTANTFGLEVWGRILGVERTMLSPDNFGIDNDGNLRLFNIGTRQWYLIWQANPQYRVSLDGINQVSNIGISDETYRRVLLSRFFTYYMRGTLPEIQTYFELLFPESQVQVSSNNDMTYDIIFLNALSNEDFNVLTLDGIIPEVAGVRANRITISRTFGFRNEGAGGDSTNDYPFTWIDADTTDYTGHGTFAQ